MPVTFSSTAAGGPSDRLKYCTILKKGLAAFSLKSLVLLCSIEKGVQGNPAT
jgi:hypothetical protein